MSQYKPYPAYKDSGVEWLGRVPEHWELKPLKRLVHSIEQGWSPECEARPAEIGEWGVTKVGCVNGGRFRPDENKALPASLEPRPELGLCKGDVLVSRANTRELVGSCVVVPQNYPNILLCDKIYRIICGELVTPGFLAGLITVHGRRAVEIEANGASSSMVNIAQSVIMDLPVAVPGISEQNGIMAAIDLETARIDALVEKKTRFIELLREKRQALITHAVTKGLNPKAKMKDSGVEWLGEVPEHWHIKRLKFIAKVQTGIAKGKDVADKDTIEVPYLRVANVQDGYLDLNEVATIEVSKEDLPRYLLRPGDVLMNEGGDFDKLGRGHVWQGEVSPCIHQNHVFAVRPHGVSSDWLNTFTSSSAAQFYFMGRSKQSTNLASISSSNLMEQALPIPNVAEQRDILGFLNAHKSQLDTLIQKTELSIELLKERRSALITAAVTGQIDLRESA